MGALLSTAWALLCLVLAACGSPHRTYAPPGSEVTRCAGAANRAIADAGAYPEGYGPRPELPSPSPAIGFRGSRVLGWPEGATPTAAPGFAVRLYARGLESPRWLHALPNGDVLVSQSSFSRDVFGGEALSSEHLDVLRAAGLLRTSPDRVTLLRDADGDGSAELRHTLVDGLDHPFGMALVGEALYVAATDALWRFPFRAGETRLAASGEKLLALPARGPNPHWTRNVVAHPNGTRLYVSVGSATDVDEEGIDREDPRRGAILEVAPDGSEMRVFASGLRNATGMAWAPASGQLWTVVNERDHLGPGLPPDFLTSLRDGGFYGWPFAYHGAHEDPSHAGERPDLVASALTPEYALGAHTAPLGLAFSTPQAFPAPYGEGAFISQHGSMRREPLAGYRVIFVPFTGGSPSGPPRDVLTGFIANEERREVYGRPAGLAVLPDGALLVADDAADRIWHVSRCEVGS